MQEGVIGRRQEAPGDIACTVSFFYLVELVTYFCKLGLGQLYRGGFGNVRQAPAQLFS